MNKRVHEIAKERGLPAKDVLARLKAAGDSMEMIRARFLCFGGKKIVFAMFRLLALRVSGPARRRAGGPSPRR